MQIKIRLLCHIFCEKTLASTPSTVAYKKIGVVDYALTAVLNWFTSVRMRKFVDPMEFTKNCCVVTVFGSSLNALKNELTPAVCKKWGLADM